MINENNHDDALQREQPQNTRHLPLIHENGVAALDSLIGKRSHYTPYMYQTEIHVEHNT